jgi:hypothetical protein
MATRKLRFAEHSEDWAVQAHAPQDLRLTLTGRRSAAAAHRDLAGSAPAPQLTRAINAALVDLEQTACRRVSLAAGGGVEILTVLTVLRLEFGR